MEKCVRMINVKGKVSTLSVAVSRSIYDYDKLQVVEMLIMAGVVMDTKALYDAIKHQKCHCDESIAELFIIGGCEVVTR